jgi:hypothetical protein
MSYDFACFRLPPGADIHTIYEEAMEGNANGPLDPEAAKQHLAELLRARNPRLDQFAMDYEAVAASEGTIVEAVRRRYRNVELTDEDSGLQINIDDWGVSVTIPYWHNPARRSRFSPTCGLTSRSSRRRPAMSFTTLNWSRWFRWTRTAQHA